LEKKIRVLVLPSDPFGVGHYRSIWPSQNIQKNHSDNFHVDIRLNQPVTKSDLGKFDIVHFHRRINKPKETLFWIKEFQKSGSKVICDVDDYWMPFHGHPARQLAINAGIPTQILDGIKHSDYISTTTKFFADHIKKHNNNVVIMPNAIDNELPMWCPNDNPSDRVRVGWIGGSSHELDLSILEGTFNKLLSDVEVKDKIQIVMCGYDTRGTMTEVHPVTKEERTRPITPKESVWNKFEKIFNSNGKADSDQYVRRNTIPITQYGKHYNHVDICLAPLAQNTFNECKSELKLIETGMKAKALVASDLYMYGDMIEHGVNGMLVNPRKNHKDWYKHIKKLILDEDLRKNLSKNLHYSISMDYNLNSVTNKRCEFYKDILND
jgi:glycosyltransferase involved in cell wall biosynthesis